MRAISTSVLFIVLGACPEFAISPAGAAPGSVACRQIAEVNVQIQALQARRIGIPPDDKSRLCPILAEQIGHHQRMLDLIEGDDQACGVPSQVVQQLKTTAENLRMATKRTCGN